MKNIKIEIKWAIIFTLMMLVWMVLERLFGFHDTHIDQHHIYSNFVAIPAIAVYVFALLDKRKNFYRGKMTYIQGFVSGLIITLMVTVLSPLVQVITTIVIAPDYFQNAIDHAVTEGKMTREGAEEYFNLNTYLIQVLIGTPVMGVMTSAVVAIFTRKK